MLASCICPSKSTLLRAESRKYLTSWPGMTTELVTKYLPNSLATAKGHLDQEFKIFQSKKQVDLALKQDIDPPQEDSGIITHDVMRSMFNTKELNSKIYSDQTGKKSYSIFTR